MPLDLIIAPLARLDQAEIATFLSRDHPEVSLRLLQAAEDTFRQLTELHPLSGKVVTANPRLAVLRVWPVRGFDNYLVFYRISSRAISIARVLHGARDIESLLEGS